MPDVAVERIIKGDKETLSAAPMYLNAQMPKIVPTTTINVTSLNFPDFIFFFSSIELLGAVRAGKIPNANAASGKTPLNEGQK
jgi:hypothetical protein